MNGRTPQTEPRPGKHRLFPVLFACQRLLALFLVVLLLRSAFAHLGNPYLFLSSVYAYQLTGIVAGKLLALTLPYLQMVLAVCLVARWWMQTVYLVALSIFLVFTAAQVLALLKGLEISCGCFGGSTNLQVGAATLTLAGSAALACLLGYLLSLLRDRQSLALSSGGATS